MKKFLAKTLILLLSFPFPTWLHAQDLALPSDDISAPVVKHIGTEKPASAKDGHVFSATVTDDVGVAGVILYYRATGAMTYQRIAMTRLGNSDEYTAFLDPKDLPPEGIEYYIQAKDLAGNSLLRGYSFSPLKLTVDSQSAPSNTTSSQQETAISSANQDEASPQFATSDESEDSIWSNKWLWIGVGAVALLGLAGGGGGGGDKTGTISGTIPQP